MGSYCSYSLPRLRSVNSILPTLAKRHSERALENPDFQYILDQQVLAEDISQKLPSLNEALRRSEREQQEADYLAIENTRRLAKGETALASLDELLDEEEATESSETTLKTAQALRK